MQLSENVWYCGLQILFRGLLSVLIGGIIGRERASHGRAAGMRTHILVCLGSCMTSLTGMYVVEIIGSQGDLFRISAQVMSGIGFLGAGMIIHRGNNMISGLTTAAGVWATGAIGIALGYGFYTGAIIVTLLFLLTTVVLARFERDKKDSVNIYIEIDDMSRTNDVLKTLEEKMPGGFSHQIMSPKSGYGGNLGIMLTAKKRPDFDVARLCEIQHIIFATED